LTDLSAYRGADTTVMHASSLFDLLKPCLQWVTWWAAVVEWPTIKNLAWLMSTTVRQTCVGGLT